MGDIEHHRSDRAWNGGRVPSPWWTECVLYEVYVRSFADADGDGVGDLAGVTARLPYLGGLGVDALWLTPFYVPAGRPRLRRQRLPGVDPLFGDLGALDDSRAGARPGAAGHRRPRPQPLLVAHPCSSRTGGGPGRRGGPASTCAPAADPTGGTPNDWPSVFGGPAWTRVPDGEWYLHLFDPAQPD